MRKIMILAREAGGTVEMNDISNNGFYRRVVSMGPSKTL